MSTLIASRLTRLLPAIALPVTAMWAMFSITLLSPGWQALLIDALPVVTLALAMLLSIRFNRSRFSFLLLFLTLAWVSQTHLRGQLLPATESLLFAALMTNSFVFSLLKDRNLFSIHGLLRLAVFLPQAIAIWYLVTFAPALPLALLNREWFTLPGAVAILVQLPDSILLGALLINLAHMTLSIARNSSVQATFFACQLGLLGIASGYPHAAFVPFMVSSCALLVALAIIMDSHDMAYRDELTALPSRRALNQRLLSLGRCYTIAMLDIDHFKKFNDIHGHDVGDEVLQMVAAKIARVAGGGKPFRYGGEEFTIVFAGKSPRQAQQHLEALRSEIENYQMVMRQHQRRNQSKSASKSAKRAGLKARSRRGRKGPANKSLSVTISIGYATREGDLKLPEAVIKAADQALYRAKNKGRNCLSI
jgi:diguanylate cyclase (GGDEF)-like protein